MDDARNEIKICANQLCAKFGSKFRNEWLDDVLTDKRGARSLISAKNRRIVPIYNPTYAQSEQFVTHAEIYNIMHTFDFKKFIESLKH